MSEEGNTLTVITRLGVLVFGAGLLAGLNITTFFQDEAVVQVSCGREHSAVVCESGRVYLFGWNRYVTRTGNDDNTVVPRLVDTPSSVRITQAACGDQHTLFLADEGDLYLCGYARLGLGHGDKVPTPVLVTGLPPIKKIAAGFEYTVVLTDRGEVWGCGHNSEGQLGLGHTNSQTSFARVPNLPECIVDISCGVNNTALITASRVLLMAGCNIFGHLGSGENDLTSFKAVSTAIAAVSCGSCHTVGLRVDGTSCAWGSNDHGESGTGTEGIKRTNATKVVGFEGQTVSQVIAGFNHSAMLTQEGDVWVWGKGTSGELGQGKKCLSIATMLAKSPGLVVQQVAFAETYTLMLVVLSSTKTPASQLQIGAIEEGDAAITDLERSIMRSLECPVCMKVMCAPIHLCAKGHSLCAACMYLYMEYTTNCKKLYPAGTRTQVS